MKRPLRTLVPCHTHGAREAAAFCRERGILLVSDEASFVTGTDLLVDGGSIQGLRDLAAGVTRG